MLTANGSLSGKAFHPLGLGCWVFDRRLWSAEGEEALQQTMLAALQHGINHFDTATGYGSGSSEQVVGRFLAGHREQVFIASKANVTTTAQAMLDNVKRSLERLQTDVIDLYYIHWPDSSIDMRPAMEGLETARHKGLIRAMGVSNFSTADMEQVLQAGCIDAHQLGYNLFWRFREHDVIAFCRERGIPVITYSSLAQGILTGKFPRQLDLPPGDQRRTIVFFQEKTWPVIYEAVEQLKVLAEESGRPLQHLAIRWTLAQPGIACALAGARSPEQVRENAVAMQGEIPAGIFERMTAISDEVMRQLPDTGNMYSY
jgi:aryl-alcohol dehydrogenase-like predicted oxidoreductase